MIMAFRKVNDSIARLSRWRYSGSAQLYKSAKPHPPVTALYSWGFPNIINNIHLHPTLTLDSSVLACDRKQMRDSYNPASKELALLGVFAPSREKIFLESFFLCLN
jgi:hypothetical protein